MAPNLTSTNEPHMLTSVRHFLQPLVLPLRDNGGAGVRCTQLVRLTELALPDASGAKSQRKHAIRQGVHVDVIVFAVGHQHVGTVCCDGQPGIVRGGDEWDFVLESPHQLPTVGGCLQYKTCVTTNVAN